MRITDEEFAKALKQKEQETASKIMNEIKSMEVIGKTKEAKRNRRGKGYKIRVRLSPKGYVRLSKIREVLAKYGVKE